MTVIGDKSLQSQHLGLTVRSTKTSHNVTLLLNPALLHESLVLKFVDKVVVCLDVRIALSIGPCLGTTPQHHATAVSPRCTTWLANIPHTSCNVEASYTGSPTLVPPTSLLLAFTHLPVFPRSSHPSNFRRL